MLRQFEFASSAAPAFNQNAPGSTGAIARATTNTSSGLPAAVRFAVFVLQFALILLVIHRYQIENRTFFNVMALTGGGFAVHALLPLRYRMPFFTALSFASVLVAFGPTDGLFLIALALVPIGICHLPLGFGLRISLLLATCGVFGLWRAELIPGPWSVAIWPIIGSMLMFRIALYLYALKHEQQKATLSSTLAYFFMLPNVCFPLFPVVDYSTFRRNYYDIDAHRIYMTGFRWVIRGLVHLILYRLVYVHLTGDPMELRSLGQLVQYVLATFLLYLRVSGSFHLIIGVLHLFGCRLPETHHLYYLASSFTDFWRRINIYWKDFMMRLVYYPSFFEFKRFGAEKGLIGATIVVFFGTWLLHSYQWFWLRGGFPLEIMDGLFWGILGALVVYGALRDMKKSRKRTLGGLAAAPKGWNLSLALRTARTFTAICVLWSLWSAESMSTWFLMWTAALNTNAKEVIAILALVAAGLAIAGREWSVAEGKPGEGPFPYVTHSFYSIGTLVALLALSSPSVYELGGPKVASVMTSLQQSTLNEKDKENLHKGYYEKLDSTSRMSAQLWDLTAHRPATWIPLVSTPVYQARLDFLGAELKPRMSIQFLDKPLTTNSWGMRDSERELEKPAGVHRIAVLGPSLVMGSGVGDADTFTRQLEDRWNAAAGPSGPRIEVLNFGIAGYALTQQLAMFEERALRFKPDIVLFTDNNDASRTAMVHLLSAAARNMDVPFDNVRSLLQDTGVTALADPGPRVLFGSLRSMLAAVGVQSKMPWTEGEHRMRRQRDDMLSATFADLNHVAKRAGVVPVYLALDTVQPPLDKPSVTVAHAKRAGMLVFNLLDLWAGKNLPDFRTHPSDNHPNEEANRIIAARLQELIARYAAELRLTPDKRAANSHLSAQASARSN